MNVLRLLGAALTVSCGVAAGLTKRRRIMEHAGFISGMASACERICSEISSGKTPPKEIFARLAGEKGASGRFFDELAGRLGAAVSVEAEWKYSVERAASEYSLSENEKTELENIGTMLSKYDLENLLSAMSAAASRLRQMSDELGKTADRDAKVWLSVFASAGVIAALMLL